MITTSKAPQWLEDAVFALWMISTAMLLTFSICAVLPSDVSPSGHRPALPSVYDGGGIQG